MTPVLGQRLRAERAFERLYDRHVGDVYRYSLALLRNPSDAEDVTQTTFLNAYRAYREGERPEAPRAWLIAIAHNVCRQRFRTAARRVQEVAYEETVAEAVVRDPEAPSAEEIQRALGQLAFNQRAALVMRELEGRSYAEIAEVLGVSTSAVETLLFRARRALREQLEGSISCDEAEVAISKQLDGRLSRAERGSLRAHLRECGDCATLARKQRAQRSAIRGLGLLPLPSSLAAWGGGAAATGTAVGGGVAMKAAALVAAGTVAVGVGREAATRIPDAPAPDRVAAEATAGTAAATRAPAVAVTPVRTASLRTSAPGPTSPAAPPAHGRDAKPAKPTVAVTAAPRGSGRGQTSRGQAKAKANAKANARASVTARAKPKPNSNSNSNSNPGAASAAKAKAQPRIRTAPKTRAAPAATAKPKPKVKPRPTGPRTAKPAKPAPAPAAPKPTDGKGQGKGTGRSKGKNAVLPLTGGDAPLAPAAPSGLPPADDV